MRKTALAIGTSLLVSLVTALPAFADSGLPDPDTNVHGGGGTAFTGANLSPFILAFVVLAIVGFSALALQRRRASTA